MSIRAIFFDIGGILELTPPTGWEARWEGELGLPPGELDARLQEVWKGGSIGSITEEEANQSIRRILGLSPEQLERLLADTWEEYLGAPNVELIKYFSTLRPTYKTGIISNSFVGAREKEEKRYQFSALCDVIIYSHEVGLSKPDPRIFELACEQLKARPEESIFLDDVAGHASAARDLGMKVVLFEDNAQAILEIEGYLRG